MTAAPQLLAVLLVLGGAAPRVHEAGAAVTSGAPDRPSTGSTEAAPSTPLAQQDSGSGVGQLLGDACDKSCSHNLVNVLCDQERHTCECEPAFPVRLSPTVGCAKPVRLGEQCFHDRTCTSNEPHSACIQIHHNAICQCKSGFHMVVLHKPRDRVFCSEDILVIKTDLHTLFGMAAGISVITGLICFVLKLYSRARYSPPRHYANAGLPPPIMFASETGIPLAVQRAPSRSSGRHSAPPFSRRPSSSMGLIGGGHSGSSRAGAARAAAILLISCHFDHNPVAGTSRQSDEECAELEEYEMDDIFALEEDDEESPALQDDGRGRNKFRGSRRPSTASYNSSTSSIRSYGVRRLEEENERKYQRQVMKMQTQQPNQQPLLNLQKGSSGNLISSSLGSGSFGGGSFGAVSFGTTCRTPLSTDDLLPSVRELVEPVSQPGSSGSQHKTRTTSLQPIIAPSSSSSESSPVDDRTRKFLQGCEVSPSSPQP